jgi:SpoVK/Ycf46/Vps4 family AAA+-type ATPase
MTLSQQEHWLEINQRYLSTALNVVRGCIEEAITPNGEEDRPASAASSVTARKQMEQIAAELDPPPALQTLSALFTLSPFEHDLLLLCAGVEMDFRLAEMVAVAQGNSRRSAPTFSLALAVLPDAHWSALTPTAPLRRWRLIEMGTGSGFSNSPLQIDERILHYLTGVSYIDPRLRGLVASVADPPNLPASHVKVAEKIIRTWSGNNTGLPAQIIQLCGDQHASLRAVAARACAELKLELHAIHTSDIPSSSVERDALARLWEREAVLSNSALLVEGDISDHTRTVTSLIENIHSLIIVSTPEPMRLRQRSSIRLEIDKPSTTEQLNLWQDTLGPSSAQLNGQLEKIIANFSLDPESIYEACVQAVDGQAHTETELGQRLWEACRAQARQPLDELAQRIPSIATWQDLVLPESQSNNLREIATHVRQRTKVYETWGFAKKASRGLGISALFVGTSGTGKTMAAEVLANELQLDLYRIDLSQVVNKYIGETEKNLRRVFDAADDSGAILLFDEADALFGKRSDVKDSHDRYANIEVSYLLQRMEEYRGLAILTTNMKKALDQAFMRRIRFVVQFPFPDAGLRAEIWQRIFPNETPTKGLDIRKLARLDIAGGNIRNIAMNAAFLAAEAGAQVRMDHVRQAARSEYAKLERTLGNELNARRRA